MAEGPYNTRHYDMKTALPRKWSRSIKAIQKLP
jgi:hypothetical protein